MTQTTDRYKARCLLCPVGQDLQDMKEYYANLVATQGKQDIRLWADYHRGSQHARVKLAEAIVEELSVALAGNGRPKQDYEDL